MNRTDDRREQLCALAFRFTGFGIGSDLAALTTEEAWGLFVFLGNLSGVPHG